VHFLKHFVLCGSLGRFCVTSPTWTLVYQRSEVSSKKLIVSAAFWFLFEEHELLMKTTATNPRLK
jgi:hypothetical protein